MKTYPLKKTKAVPRKEIKEEKDEPNFLDAVYTVVRRIPRGRVTSYGAVAEATGMRISARMVGWALSMCGRVRPAVPAHRVVNRMGLLSGKHHFATRTLMQELLEAEGVKVEDDTVKAFADLFWDPQGKRKKKE